MGTLTQASSDRRTRVMTHIEALPPLADDIERGVDDAEARLAAEHEFLVASLLPLMEIVETRLYPELDRLMSCRLAMTPMEREHAEARRLIAHVGQLRTERGVSRDAVLASDLRRLHALVSAHLAEETSYARILEHNLDDVAADALGGSMQDTAVAV